MKRINLPNNCWYSRPSVHPKGWKGSNPALLKKDWYISYRFYDGNTGKSVQKQVKANQLADLEQRQGYVQMQLDLIEEMLERKGYNPITKTSIIPIDGPDDVEISGLTPFVEALKYAVAHMKKAKSTMADLNRVVANVEAAANKLHFSFLSIGEIKKKHIRQILDLCSVRKDGQFSGDMFNRHRTYLGIIYKDLMEFDAVEVNLPYAIGIRKEEAKKPVEVFTVAERQKIYDYLNKPDDKYKSRFLLLLMIFHSSGARITEFLRLKPGDVDLKRHRVLYLVEKGDKYEYKYRPIMSAVADLWRQAMEGCAEDEYIWGPRMSPGKKPYTYNALRLAFYAMAKELNIKGKGMYIFKHTHTTAVRKVAGLKGAAAVNAESESMIKKHYDADAIDNEMDELRTHYVPFLPDTQKKPTGK